MKKIALVTGASRGIGASIAVELSRQDFFTIGTATSIQGAEIIQKNFALHDLEGQGMVLNVNDNESIAQLLATISEKYGDVEVLVNNAGITKDTLLMRILKLLVILVRLTLLGASLKMQWQTSLGRTCTGLIQPI